MNGSMFWANYCGNEWWFLYGLLRWVNVYSTLRFMMSVGVYVIDYRKMIWNDEWNHWMGVRLKIFGKNIN